MELAFKSINLDGKNTDKVFNKIKNLVSNIEINLQDMISILNNIKEDEVNDFYVIYKNQISSISQKLKIYNHELMVLDFKIEEYNRNNANNKLSYMKGFLYE